jgi:hypothetical protein
MTVTPDGSCCYEAIKRQRGTYDSVGTAAMCLVNDSFTSNLLRTSQIHIITRDAVILC